MIIGSLELALFIPVLVLVALVGIVYMPTRVRQIESGNTHAYAVFLLTSIFVFIFTLLGVLYNLVNSVGYLARASSSSCQQVASMGSSALSSIVSNGINFAQCSIPGLLGSGSHVVSRTPREIFGNFVVIWFIALAIVSVVLYTQIKMAKKLFENSNVRSGSAGAVLSGYLFSVALVALVIFVLSAIETSYSLAMIFSPHLTGVSGRASGVQSLVSNAIVAALAQFLMITHLKSAWKLQHSLEEAG